MKSLTQRRWVAQMRLEGLINQLQEFGVHEKRTGMPLEGRWVVGEGT